MPQVQVIAGPCALQHNGQTYFSQGDVTLTYNRNMVDLSSSHVGVYDSRQRDISVQVSFTPVGQTSVLNALINYISGKVPGQSMVPGGLNSTTFAVTGNETTNLLTAAGHSFVDGDVVAFTALNGGSGLSTYQRYYVRDRSGNDFKLALTAGGAAIDFTTAIISVSTIAESVELPLVITPLTDAGGQSRIWTFWRAGITEVGDFNFSATSQVNGQITFTVLESLIPTGSHVSTAAYSAPGGALLDDFDAATVITPPCDLRWAPDPASMVSGDYKFYSEDGFRVSIALSTNSHYRESVGLGTADVTYADVKCSVSFKCANAFDYLGVLVPEQTLHTLMPATTKPGQRATRKKLTLTSLVDDTIDGAVGMQAGDNLLQFVAAEWTSETLQWGAASNRTGNITFTCTPVITSGVRTYMTPDFVV